jgi:hypothetical protein
MQCLRSFAQTRRWNDINTSGGLVKSRVALRKYPKSIIYVYPLKPFLTKILDISPVAIFTYWKDISTPDFYFSNRMEKKEPSAPNLQGTSVSAVIKPQSRKPHDPSVTFEEYHYYALRTRQEEQTYEAPKTGWKDIVLRKKNPRTSGDNGSTLQTTAAQPASSSLGRLEISDEEWTNASRAFRTASWGACESSHAVMKS